jgi:hypothetical protein
MASTPTGRLSQKIERQPIVCTSTPPTKGPAAMLRPATPAQTPMARARSRRSVKVLVMIDMATGLSIEPPTACTMRNAISRPTVGAMLHSSEPTLNSTRPTWNVRRLPSRSAVEPDSTSSAASTSVYASTVHWSSVTDAPSSRRIDGRARFTIVTSSPTMNRLMQQIASTSGLRAVTRPTIP